MCCRGDIGSRNGWGRGHVPATPGRDCPGTVSGMPFAEPSPSAPSCIITSHGFELTSIPALKSCTELRAILCSLASVSVAVASSCCSLVSTSVPVPISGLHTISVSSGASTLTPNSVLTSASEVPLGSLRVSDLASTSSAGFDRESNAGLACPRWAASSSRFGVESGLAVEFKTAVGSGSGTGSARSGL
eukprot:3186040-Rhodomonas_salina.2